MSKFKTFLYKKLKSKKISQNKFARMIDVTPTYINKMINGTSGPPDRDLQIKIANSLEIEGEERNKFFNNLAKEKDDIPSDIYEGIFSNKNSWNKIRELLKKEKIIKINLSDKKG